MSNVVNEIANVKKEHAEKIIN